MPDNSTNRSVTVVFVSVVILAIVVAGVLFTDLYSRFTASEEEMAAAEFDPNRYPSPAAGIAGKRIFPRNCNDVVFRTTKDGIKYVRESGGGVLIGAEYQKKFGFYRIEYGVLAPVDSATVNSFTKEKLEFALYNCDGPFSPSGVVASRPLPPSHPADSNTR